MKQLILNSTTSGVDLLRCLSDELSLTYKWFVLFKNQLQLESKLFVILPFSLFQSLLHRFCDENAETSRLRSVFQAVILNDGGY